MSQHPPFDQLVELGLPGQIGGEALTKVVGPDPVLEVSPSDADLRGRLPECLPEGCLTAVFRLDRRDESSFRVDEPLLVGVVRRDDAFDQGRQESGQRDQPGRCVRLPLFLEPCRRDPIELITLTHRGASEASGQQVAITVLVDDEARDLEAIGLRDPKSPKTKQPQHQLMDHVHVRRHLGGLRYRDKWRRALRAPAGLERRNGLAVGVGRNLEAARSAVSDHAAQDPQDTGDRPVLIWVRSRRQL